MGKKRTYTAEERAERARQDRALVAAAGEALADADTAADYAARLVGLAGGIQRYSLRNQALLMHQADKRELSLTGDLDTFRGWCRRGRVPRGAGLRLVCPVGRDRGQDEGQGADDEQAAADAAAEADPEAEERPRFRMAARFDFCQTVPLEEADEVQQEPEQPGDPAVWFAWLVEQAEQAGYRVEQAEPAAAAAAEEGVLRVAETEPAAQAVALARQLAGLLATETTAHAPTETGARSGEPAAATPAETAADEGTVAFDLGESYGTVTATTWTDRRGWACYEVQGPRVAGVMTMIPEPALHAGQERPRPLRVDARWGLPSDRDDHGRGVRPYARPLTVNGVPLCGAVLADPEAVAAGQVPARPDRRTGPLTCEPAPAATRARTTALLQAITAHWQARPDHAQLVERAARVQARFRSAELAGRITELDRRMAELTAERQELAAHVAELEVLAVEDEAAPAAVAEAGGEESHRAGEQPRGERASTDDQLALL